jgi:predicted MPP superfamily phosphohydrolase
LHFKDDGSFRVVVFADMHYQNGEASEQTCSDLTPEQKRWPCSDLNTTAFMNRVLDEEKPDLVVFLGDNIDGGAQDAATSLQRAFSPALDR